MGKRRTGSSSTSTKKNSSFAISSYIRNVILTAIPKRDFLNLILVESKRNKFWFTYDTKEPPPRQTNEWFVKILSISLCRRWSSTTKLQEEEEEAALQKVLVGSPPESCGHNLLCPHVCQLAIHISRIKNHFGIAEILLCEGGTWFVLGRQKP